MSAAHADDADARVVQDRLVVLADRLGRDDARIRRQLPDAVHQMRITLRRMRSLLTTFGTPYDADAVAARREDLQWVATELSGARDAEVVHARLLALATTDEERELATVLLEELRQTEAEGLQRSVASVDSERYSQVLRDLTAFATDPPWAGADGVRRDLRKRVRREWKRVRRAARQADAIEDGPERMVALHEVRKAAKRLGYAAETLVPSYGEDAARLSQRAKRVQEDLGDVQDSAITYRALRRLADNPDRTTEEIFLLGVLQERELEHSAEAVARYADSWRRLSRRKHRRWLR